MSQAKRFELESDAVSPLSQEELAALKANADFIRGELSTCGDSFVYRELCEELQSIENTLANQQ